MSTLPDLPVKIEPVVQAALRAVANATQAAGADWFVTGATARDWLLEYLHGIKTLRATKDADFGVAVRDWEEFGRIRAAILAGGEFMADERAAHRLTNALVRGFHLDLVPFGPLAENGAEIAWPPDNAIVMNVIGFQEAFEAAVPLRVADDLVVKVASLPGLMLMKLFAWRDRRHENTPKDAWDLKLLLTNYERAGNENRIYDEGVMALEDFDAGPAAARLLGRDVARLLRPETRRALLELLDDELIGDANTLAEQIAHVDPQGGIGGRDLDGGARFGHAILLLERFRAGLDD